MNHFIAGVVRAAAEAFHFPGPILEVGSNAVAGQEEIAQLRPLFPGRQYIGIDFRDGPGVDSVENIEALPRPDHSVGSVLALNVLEHVERFWLGVAEMKRVLRSDGLMMISCPFYFHQHAYPSDYWRFTPEALDSLLRDLPTRIIGCHGPARRPLNCWALVAGPDYPAISDAQHRRFDALIARYAHQRLRPAKAWRYRLGRLLCGQRPLAPYLQAERFETRLRRAA